MSSATIDCPRPPRHTSRSAYGFVLSLVALLVALSAPAHARLPHTGPYDVLGNEVTCGGYKEQPCSIFTDFFWYSGSGSCDRGLKEDSNKCVNGSGDRARFSGLVDDFIVHRDIDGNEETAPMFEDVPAVENVPAEQSLSYWTTWALKNQRTQLAVDEPLNWVMHLQAHNSYSNLADGYILTTNQRFSLTDQLRLGARTFELDSKVIGAGNWMRLVHGTGETDRFYFSAIKEFETWLDQNPDEIIVLAYEDEPESTLSLDRDAKQGNPLEEYLGDRVYKPEDWPTVLSSATICDEATSDLCFVDGDPVTDGGTNDANTLSAPRMPTRREMLASGKQVIASSGNRTDSHFWTTGERYSDGRNLARVFGFDGSCTITDNDDFDSPYKTYSWFEPLAADPFHFYTSGFTMNEQKRRLTWTRVREARSVDNLYAWVGLMNRDRVEELARCNVTRIALDLLYAAGDTDGEVCSIAEDGDAPIFSPGTADEEVPDACPDDDDRARGLVWSWKEGDFGEEGYALLDHTDGRWTSAPKTEQHHFACAVARPIASEAGDPATWTDWQGVVWAVTKEVGVWDDGDAICNSEYGPTGTYRSELESALGSDGVFEAIYYTAESFYNCSGGSCSTLSACGWKENGVIVAGSLPKADCVSKALAGGIVFGVPANGWQNDRLVTRRAVASDDVDFDDSSEDVWLNYRADPVRFGWRVYDRPVAHSATVLGCPGVEASVREGSVHDEGETLFFDVVNQKPECGALDYHWDFGDGESADATSDGFSGQEKTYADNGPTFSLADCEGPTCPTVDVAAQKKCIEDLVAMGSTPEDALLSCPDEDFPIEDAVLVQPYNVQFTATDVDGNSSTSVLQITIENVAPVLTATGSTISENGLAEVSGTITDPGIEDTFTLVVDWKEGEPETFTYPAGTTEFSESHRYLDDNPTGTSTDHYDVELNLTDDDGGEDDLTADVAVSNLAPEIASLEGDIIDENDTATIQGRIADVGTQDTFTVEIDWGDPLSPNNTEELSFGDVSIDVPGVSWDPATRVFAIDHQYLDDNPSVEPFNVYTVGVEVTDDDGGTGSDSTEIGVNNVAPVIHALLGDAIDENGVATVQGNFTDVGSLDTFTLTIDWGDGLSPNNMQSFSFAHVAIADSGVSWDPATGAFAIDHQYLDDNPTDSPSNDYVVMVSVTDDDSGNATASTGVTVDNVDPVAEIDALRDSITGASLEFVDREGEVVAGVLSVVLVGTNIELEGSYTDIGSLDLHFPPKPPGAPLPSVDWDDGTVDDVPLADSGVNEDGAFGATEVAGHRYATDLVPGLYTIGLTITDDDTGSDTPTATVRVVDAAGALADALADLRGLIDEGDLPPDAEMALLEAIYKLTGNPGDDDGDGDGDDENGALDHLERENLNPTLIKIEQAIQYLEAAEASDADLDLTAAKAQLSLVARSIVETAIDEATTMATKKSELRKIAEAETLRDDGDAALGAQDYLGALEAYIDAVRKVENIIN